MIIHPRTSHFFLFYVHFNIIFHCTPACPKRSFLFRYSDLNVVCSYIRNSLTSIGFIFTCRKISPSFVDRYKYMSLRPAGRGAGSDSSQGVLLPPYPFHHPFAFYCDVAPVCTYFASSKLLPDSAICYTFSHLHSETCVIRSCMLSWVVT
jgi:hypothetical protein